MSIDQCKCLLASLLLAATVSTRAQEDKAAPPAPPATPAANVDQLLAFIPEIVATVDNQSKVSRQDLVGLLKPQLEKVLANGVNVPEEQIQSVAYNLAKNLATHEVLLQAAINEKLTLDMEAAQKLLDEAKEKQGEEAFNAMIKEQGLPLETLTRKIAETNAIRAYHENFIAGLDKVGDDEVQKFYDDNQEQFTKPDSFSAAHILAKFESDTPDDDDKAKALAKINEVKKQLDAGADFAELAQKFSDCPSKEQGGDLGEFAEGSMVPEFEAALKKMQKDEISQAVETKFGYHIIKAGASSKAEKIDFDSVKDKIAENLKSQGGEEAFRDKIEALYQAAKVEIKLPEPELDNMLQ